MQSNIETKFVYSKSVISSSIYAIIGLLVIIGIFAIVAISTGATPDYVAIGTLILFIFIIFGVYMFNRNISYAITDVELVRFLNNRVKWRIPINTLIEVGPALIKSRYRTCPDGYIIKTNSGKLYRIQHDLTNATDPEPFINKLVSLNANIKIINLGTGHFGQYKGSSLTREYFWKKTFVFYFILIFLAIAATVMIVNMISKSII